VTGTYQGWRQVETLDALTGTDYGRLVLLKAAGFIALVALGAFARQILKPQDREPDLRTLRRSVGVEFGIALCVLGVTSLLVESQPRGPSPRPGQRLGVVRHRRAERHRERERDRRPGTGRHGHRPHLRLGANGQQEAVPR